MLAPAAEATCALPANGSTPTKTATATLSLALERSDLRRAVEKIGCPMVHDSCQAGDMSLADTLPPLPRLHPSPA